LITILFFGINACASESKPISETTHIAVQTVPVITEINRICQPTVDDGVSPSYKPNTPERTVVGHGHVVTGVVFSSVDCTPITNAKLEFWPEERVLGHPDSSRATFFTNQNGQYRFECNLPEHIHMQISAPGYRTIGVNSYHPEGKAEGIFDIVLEPE
jgi:protocatechuate 3,4-dioxygenase beta subunit